MAPKSAQQWDRSSAIHPSFFEWPPPKLLESWEAVLAGERIIQLACVVPDTDVCLLFNMMESCQLPQSWLRETYPAIWKQCMDYGTEMEAVSKERDRLSAEFLKQKHSADGAGKRSRASPEQDAASVQACASGSCSAASTSMPPAGRTKRARRDTAAS